ncbi:MAG: PQQ-binding-like beta-propeller repeat protein [Clostridia bacterium]|nr:PQQ-binding-like beta-propeller repeat protein [Clostridia bacterium]
MKERIIALSLGLSFTFPAIFDSFSLPLFFKNHLQVNNSDGNSTKEQIVAPIADDLIKISEGEYIEIYDESSLDNVVEAAKTNITKAFIPFDYKNEMLINFKAQNITQEPNGYLSKINMDGTLNYDSVHGISTFRSNNYRENAFYGKLNVAEKKLEKIWTNTIGQTDSWTGIGWNGQPSIIRWDDDVKNQMNLYNEFKLKENFTEVIVGGLDSTVHFYDLETGLPSRPIIKVPSSIKGSVTIDPRGYPLLYVGQGIDKVGGVSVKFGYHIFSLITGEELFFINGRDKFAYLSWGAFDGNPVIDAKTDTMVLPGENGLVYVVRLNTNYDREKGIVSVSPITTKYRYTKNGKAGGIENAMTIYKNYAFFANNNGVVQCLELASLSPVWSFNMEDDCDATIGLEEENDEIFLYVGCEVDKRKTASPAVVRKLNGRTGEAIWEYSCYCQYDADVNGGVLSSPLIGKNSISDLVIFNFSKVTSLYNGKMVALNKTTGELVWEKDLKNYSWSSPVAVYSESNDAYIIFGDSGGIMHLIDAKTGKTVYQLQTGGGNMEGSPAVFDNHIVIGTRGKKVFRIDIK